MDVVPSRLPKSFTSSNTLNYDQQSIRVCARGRSYWGIDREMEDTLHVVMIPELHATLHILEILGGGQVGSDWACSMAPAVGRRSILEHIERIDTEPDPVANVIDVIADTNEGKNVGEKVDASYLLGRNQYSEYSECSEY